MNTILELIPPEQGTKSDAEIQALITMLRQEATLFIAANSNNIFNLGNDYVQAILFHNLYQYVDIPPLTDSNDLKQIVMREKALAARDSMFQLVAKAELENAQAKDSIAKSAEQFGISILESVGKIGMGYLINMLLVALI